MTRPPRDPAIQDFIDRVGKNIRRRRKLLGMTMQDVSSSLSCGYRQVSKWERGENVPSFYTMLQLCSILRTGDLLPFIEGTPFHPSRSKDND